MVDQVKSKEDRWQEYLDLEKTQPAVLPQGEKPDRWQEYLRLEGGTKPPPIKEEPNRWQEEFWPSMGEVVGEIPTIKNWAKFITKEVLSGEFWKGAGGTLQNQLQQFIREKVLDPREVARVAVKLGYRDELSPEYQEWYDTEGYKSVVGEAELKYKPGIKEIGKGALHFIAFLPMTLDKFAQDPGGTIAKEPLSVMAMASVFAKGGHSAIKGKLKGGKPVTGKDIHRIVDEMPKKLLTNEQKLKIKASISEQMEIPLEGAQGSAVQIIIDALKQAKVYRTKQEVMYTAERGERFPKALAALQRVRGRKGFEAGKAKLKGEMKKVSFEPIAQKLSQKQVKELFDQIIDSPHVAGIDKFPAGEGLAKLLGKKGGVVPTAGELKLLGKVFGDEFIQTVLSKRTRWDLVKGGMLEAANIPRALMASYDLSFGLRQGIFLAARYPKEFGSSFKRQFKLFGSDKAFKALKEEIASRPTYELMKRHGEKHLQLTEMDAGLAVREEAMMGAAWAEKIPLVGKGVRASNRAYTGFANKLRADVFDHLIKGAEKTGRNPWKDDRLVDSIIDFVNAGSGRGSLGKFEKSAVGLNTALFSPRLMASRLNLLNPKFYYKLDPFVRKQALQSLFAFTGMTATVLGLAKLSGAEVETNMRSADFGKIKIGNTRIDIMGGFQQYIRTAAQFATGQIKSTTTGEVAKVGEGYKPPTRLGIVGKGLEYKLAPAASFAVALMRGRGTFGEPLSTEAINKFIPMVIQDMRDLIREDPELLPVSVLGIFGTGIQTYGPKGEKVIY